MGPGKLHRIPDNPLGRRLTDRCTLDGDGTHWHPSLADPLRAPRGRQSGLDVGSEPAAVRGRPMDNGGSFGRWLRRQRKSRDLTQAGLAAQVGVATTTIEKIETEQRRPSQQTAERLASALALEPAQRSAFVRWARGERRADALRVLPPAPLPEAGDGRAGPHLSPTLTSFIGRERELAEAVALLQSDVRLLTLTGPGGVGKTRLSLELAAMLRGTFADGVHIVALAPVQEPALVLPTIAQGLGVHERRDQALALTLQTALRDRHLLLVLDNFEHLLDAAVVVADLLRVVPALSVLATSRAPLHLAGELLFAVPPLTLPDPDHAAGVAHVAQSEAGALFCARAQAVRRDFDVTPTTAPTIATICQRLDGLPLALELAAARIAVLSPHGLLQRLTQRLPVLTGGSRDLPARQQTIRATIDWSYALLTAPEQALFRRLGVFTGGFTLAAAEAVCGGGAGERESGDDRGVVDGLAQLVDTSLVEHRGGVGGEPRFFMLETIREYALERLAASGDVEPLAWQHAGYFTTLVEAWARRDAQRHRGWWDRLAPEHPNVRAALAWSRTEASGEIGLRLTVALFAFWRARGHLREGYRWFVDAVTPRVAGLADASPTLAYRSLRAQALMLLGVFATFLDDFDGAQRWLEESLALYEALGDRAGIASAHAHRGMLLQMQGDFVRAGVELETSLRLHRDRGQVYDIGLGLFFLGTLAYSEGNVDHARGLWEESLQLLRAGDDSWDIANVLAHLAMVALDNGDAVQAGAYLRESLGRFRDLDERWQTIRALEISAQQAALRGRHTADAQSHSVQAARLYGAAEALRETMDTPQMAIYRAHYRRAVAVLWTQLDPTAGLAAWAAGRALTLQQAVDEALKTLDGGAEAAAAGADGAVRKAPSRRSATQLTAREVAVLKVVAEGATDQDVAERLGLQRRTVTSYLTSIYAKLDVRTRTAAVRVARERNVIASPLQLGDDAVP